MGQSAAPRIALTLGEPAGIGPDLCLAIAQQPWEASLVAVGCGETLRARAVELDMPLELISDDGNAEPHRPGTLRLADCPTAVAVAAGHLDQRNAQAVLDMLRQAGQGCLDGVYDAVVTGPVQKSVINDAGIHFTGHTEFFAELTGAPRPVMLLAADNLRVALATTHLPLREVADAINEPGLSEVLRILHRDLRARMGLETPRILVCGLNPHAGEGGHLGREELDIIIPCLERLRAEGLDLVGPLPADTLFTPRVLEGADAVLAMYHDQGLPVLKHVGFGHAVNITLGLPIIRTSVDHGTALDLAGTGRADAGSLVAALHSAIAMVHASRSQ
ncbi:4-hydroxythreonine-4-phosphate dehydrogenase [Natronocella acetinitrilica]|uniref:4-hydroxythreonine-4-phosphate dehydrogenase n=1 Tax=Natronocella acetinitrilica TaxID=414046 RepID=A0AAE3K9R7_9GAMM|nr:4-hydroxythreonine-4-phosphate dehydrogenase PdxA [Natronocella acetinitrilica]MCP1672980.1 4-hydroxythreonine-4-phosphate dehydrogenase [Natronocella acetinitrilica]